MTAIHYAYNKDEIIQRITGGTAAPTCNFNSPLIVVLQGHPVPGLRPGQGQLDPRRGRLHQGQ